jgi:hypothetical protein
LAIAASYLADVGLARGAFAYLDSTNPGGVPDLSQLGEPICAAAAGSDAFWDWSDNAPFNAPTHPLVGHTNPNNFATNWGSDSSNATLAMANWIYGPKGPNGRNAGLGVGAGMVYRAKTNNQAYNAKNYPNGISVRYRANPTYAAINSIVTAAASNAVLGIKWYEADGTAVRRPARGAGDRYHAVALAGMDDAAKRIAISNPWGDHAAPMDPNPVVSTGYYDNYALDAAQITANGTPRLPLAGAGNQAFVSTFDTATQAASYVGFTALWEVRRGGSPHVTNVITPTGMDQRIDYTVSNPDEFQPMNHVYLKLDLPPADLSLALLSAQSYLASNVPTWNAAFLAPNSGPEHDLFDVTIENDPAVTPQYELDNWTNGMTGLHLWSDVDPLNLGEQLLFSIQLPTSVSPLVFDDVYAVADAARQLAYFGVTQGVPEPAALALGACSVWGLALLRRRDKRRGREQ